ncbi:hypothetical protein ACSIGC_06330 [Tenacibaculum sp. ZS6-P6]|uniref:hypothetical protein n=1 Tax=Tenacibaculum sp. ZS6-P6 TaxID=3447503 RepID=UPI003F9E41B1
MLLFRKTLFNFFSSRKYYTSYYKRTINKYKYPEAYLKLYTSLNSFNKTLETEVNISFLEGIGFGANLHKVKAKLRNSYRVVNELKSIVILFTEVKMLGYKFIIEMHFFKQKLVCFKYVFRNELDKTRLKNMIAEKYLKELNISDDLIDYCIKDVNENYIFLIDEVSLSINYMSYKYGFYNHLSQLNTEREIKELLKRKKETIELYNRL